MTASWLALERYALGECAPDEVRAIEAALTADPASRSILAAIRADARPLPELGPLPPREAPSRRWAVVGLALAAVVAAVLGGPEVARRAKGGDAAIEVVHRVDGLAVATGDVAVGEVLGLRVTCSGGPAEIDVVVFQDGDASFPVDRASVACGNRVPVPGAFRFDARGPAAVCAAVGDPPDRARLARDRAASDACVDLRVR